HDPTLPSADPETECSPGCLVGGDDGLGGVDADPGQFHEQVLGWNAYISQARATTGAVHGYQRLHQPLADFAAAQVLPFDQAAAAVFDSLRNRRIRVARWVCVSEPSPFLQNITVLTRNLRDFPKVPGLRVEDRTL